MHVGHDFGVLMRHAPRKHCRLDQYGWLGLSGEPDCADLNMAVVVRGATSALLNDYLSEIRSRELAAVLVIDPTAGELGVAAAEAGLVPAGTVPVMRRHAAPISPIPRAFTVRQATTADVSAANELAAEAFSLDRAALQRTFPATCLADGVDFWVVEDAGGPIGSGMFVRNGDSVGVYTMSTPARQQRRGIGRAVLEHAMLQYQAQGVTAFTLEATAQGLHLYEQLGFRTVMEAQVFVFGSSTQFP